MGKNCKINYYYDNVKKFISGLHIEDVIGKGSENFIGKKITDFESYQRYFTDNVKKRKELYNKRLMILKKRYPENFLKDELANLIEETNQFFKDALVVAFKDINYQMLLDGFTVARDTKDGLKYDPKEILNALESYAQDPYKLVADFNKQNFYSIVGKNVDNDLTKLQELLGIEKGSLDGEAMKRLDIVRQGMYTAGGLDSDKVYMRVLKKLGATNVYFTGQILVSALAGAPTYVTSYLVNQITARIANLGTNEKKAKKIFGSLNKFREKYGILFDENERYLGKGIMGKLGHKVKSFVSKAFPGAFNIPDVIREQKLKNKVLEDLITSDYRYARFHGDLNELGKYFDNLKRLYPEDYKKELDELNKLASDYYQKFTGLDVISNPKIFLNEGQKIRNFFFGFLSGRGKNIVRNFIDTIKEVETGMFSGRAIHEYLDVLKNYGETAANEMIMKYYLRNEAFLKMLSAFRNAGHYSFYVQRYYRETYGEEMSTEELIDQALKYTFIGNAVQTIPPIRIAINAISNMYALYATNEYGGDVYNKAKTEAVILLTNIFKEAGKRLVIPKVVTALTSAAKNGDSIEDIALSVQDAIMGAVGGYLFYGVDSIIRKGIKMESTYDYNSVLNIFGLGNKNIEEYIKASSDKTIKLLIKDFGNKRQFYLKYRLPFLKDRFFAASPDKRNYEKVIKYYQTDPLIKGMTYGQYPGNINGMGEYVYNKTTELNKYKSTKRFDDLRAAMTNMKGKTVFEKQRQEDAFARFAYEVLEKKDPDGILELFKNADKSMDKYTYQIIGMMEANKPGSGKEFLGYLMNKEFYEQAKKYGLFKYKGDEFKEKSRFLKEEIGNKYGKYLYVIDKPTRFNLEMFALRARHEDLQDIMTDPYNEKYKAYFNDVNVLSSYKNKEGEYKSDSAMRRLMILDVYSDIMIGGGEINGPKLLNIMSTIWNDNYFDIKNNPDYMKMKLGFVNDQIEKIENRPLSQQEKNILKQSYLIRSKNTLDYINKHPEYLEKYRDVYEKTMNFLYGTVTEMLDLEDHFKRIKDEEKSYNKYGDTKTSGNKTNKNYKFYNSYGGYSSSFYNNYDSTYRMNSGIYQQFKTMQYDFRPLKSYYVKPTYAGRTYTQYDRDYLYGYAKARSAFYTKYRNYGKQYGDKKNFEKPAKRLSYQKSGRAVPPRLREMPRLYKEEDRTPISKFVKSRRRSAVKYDPQRARVAVTRGLNNSKVSKKRSGRSSNTRTKRGNTSRSKNKSSNNKRNK